MLGLDIYKRALIGLALLLSSCSAHHQMCSTLLKSTYSLSFDKLQSLPPCFLKENEEYPLHLSTQDVQPFQFKLIKNQTTQQFEMILITSENQIQKSKSHDDNYLFEVSNQNSKFTFQVKLEPFPNLTESNLLAFISMSLTTIHHQLRSSSRILYQCPTGFYLVDGACSRVCPMNHFKSGGFCWKCNDNCQTCLSENTCNPCKGIEAYFEEENICVTKCPDNYFNDFNNAICVKCAEGCTTCNFPNGLCTSNYFKTDMIINLIVSSVLFGLVVLCACFCNQEKEEETASTQEQQPQQDDPAPVPQKGQDAHIKQIVEGKPGGQYNILPEDFANQDDDGEDDATPTRKGKKRLTNFAQKKLLKISSAKSFAVDDGNEDKAISHDSASKLFSKLSLSPLYVSRSDISPTLVKGSKFVLESDEGSRPNLQSVQNLEDQNSKRLVFELSDHTPSNKNKPVHNSEAVSGFLLLATKETSLGKKVNNQVPVDEDIDLDMDLSFPKQNDQPDLLNEIIYEESSREGYRQDSSMSVSKDKDESLDYHSCTICGLNKRDCMNKPCGHTVACYACMEQFIERYGICPKCQRLLTGINKMQKIKKH